MMLEDTGGVDEEGRPVLEKVDLIGGVLCKCLSSDLNHRFHFVICHC